MRTLRTVLMWLGFVCLLASVVLVLALADSATIFGGISWYCEPGAMEGTSDCTVMTGSSTLASLGLYSVSFPVTSALVGIGLLLGANVIGQSLALPQVPHGPTTQPVPHHGHAHPQYPGPQPPPGRQYQG